MPVQVMTRGGLRQARAETRERIEHEAFACEHPRNPAAPADRARLGVRCDEAGVQEGSFHASGAGHQLHVFGGDHIGGRTFVNRGELAARRCCSRSLLGSVHCRRAMLGQPPPSRHDSIFGRQSWHYQAERSQNKRCGCPVSGEDALIFRTLADAGQPMPRSGVAWL